jgi:hypothetical protein
LLQDVAVEGGMTKEITDELEAGMQGILTIKGVLEQICQPWMEGKDNLVQARVK